MRKFLLTLEEASGKHIHITKQLIEAKDRQMVKYHYHRTLKDFGYSSKYTDPKHELVGPDGNHTNILRIEPVSYEEYKILKEYLGSWTKV